MDKFGVVYKKDVQSIFRWAEQEGIDLKQNKFIPLHQGNKDKWRELLASRVIDQTRVFGIELECLAQFTDQIKTIEDFPDNVVDEIVYRKFMFPQEGTFDIMRSVLQRPVSDADYFHLRKQIASKLGRLENI